MRRNPHRFAQKDANHDEIARMFTSVPGCQFVDTSAVGPTCIPGFPDGIVMFRGARFVEIKTADGALTKGERQLHSLWRGSGVTVEIVRDMNDVRRVLGI